MLNKTYIPLFFFKKKGDVVIWIINISVSHPTVSSVKFNFFNKATLLFQFYQ